MKQTFTASITREGEWFVAQCREIDVASQGESEKQAADNLREALELHLESPTPTDRPRIVTIEVEVGVA